MAIDTDKSDRLLARTRLTWIRQLNALTLVHRLLITTALGASLTLATPVLATNWIMLQGTEPASASAYKAFGFIDIDHRRTSGSPLPAGPWQGQPMVLNQIPPEFEDNSALQFSHLRLGLRGRLLDGRLNDWVSPLAGDNAISSNATPNVKLTDVSLTLNRIPHARVRVGRFFMPGSAEGLTPAVLVYSQGVSNRVSASSKMSG